MENIIKGLEILNTYNGKLIVRHDLLKIEDFEIKYIMPVDLSLLKEIGWDIITKRENGNLIRASYDTSKL